MSVPIHSLFCASAHHGNKNRTLYSLASLLSPVTRNQQTSRQVHLHRGVYPFWYPEPRGIEAHQWQTDVDNRIRFGLRNAIALNLLKPGSTVIAVQGWKGGLGHTNTLRVLSVPTDPADLQMQPLGLH